MNRSDNTKNSNFTNKLANDSASPPNFMDCEIPSKKKHFERMNNYFVFLFSIFIIMGLTTCENDDPDPDNTFDDYCSTPMEILFKDESNNVTNTLTAYLNDFNTANCNAYKAAYDEYLGALYIYQERCELVLTEPAKIRFEDALQNAEREVASLNCE